jgi:hypothetical protein
MTRLLLPPLALLAALALSLAPGQAPGQPAVKELEPQRFTLKREGVPLREALAALTKQTGIAVADLTGRGDGPKFDLDLKDRPFWQALDAIAAASGTRLSLYPPDGGVALVSRPEAKGGAKAQEAISYRGLCRTAVKHLAVARDLESGAHVCTVQLDLAWEPRFTTFFVKTGPADVAFAPDAGGKVVKAKLPEGGRDRINLPACAHEVTLRTPAPERSSPALAHLKGNFVLIGAPRMLDLTFGGLRVFGPKDKRPEQTREGVRVRLLEAKVQRDRFVVQVVIENPPGNPSFQSHEEEVWFSSTEVWLEKKGGARLVRPVLSDPEVSGKRAEAKYHFTQKANPRVRLGKLSDWTLHVRTPGRMVEVTVPYEFKDVPLP